MPWMNFFTFSEKDWLYGLTELKFKIFGTINFPVSKKIDVSVSLRSTEEKSKLMWLLRLWYHLDQQNRWNF